MTARLEPTELIERTLDALKVRSRVVTYSQISAETKIPRNWIKAFASDPKADASVTRVVKLYEYLTGHKI